MQFSKADLLEVIDLVKGQSHNGITLVDPGMWASDGKYELRHYIFGFEGKFYRIADSRTGSHYTDYYYASEDWSASVEVTEVEPVEVVRTEWHEVKT